MKSLEDGLGGKRVSLLCPMLLQDGRPDDEKAEGGTPEGFVDFNDEKNYRRP